MSWHDYQEYQQEAAIEEFLEEELRRISEEPVFSYLAVYGDAIEARVKRCLTQAQALSDNGYAGAALTRAASEKEWGQTLICAFMVGIWGQTLISDKKFEKPGLCSICFTVP